MWLDAIEAEYKGGKVFSVPAPASGAMFISALGLLSTFEHEGEGSAIDLHRTTEAMKVSSALRLVEPANKSSHSVYEQSSEIQSSCRN